MNLQSLFKTNIRIDVLWVVRKWKAWRMSKEIRADVTIQTKQLSEHVQRLIEKAERRNGYINR